MGVKGPFLIVVPLSTIHNWQREFENWSVLHAVVYHGSSVGRKMIQDHCMFYKNQKFNQPLHGIYKFNALITTYEVIMTDLELLGQIYWRDAIIDEAGKAHSVMPMEMRAFVHTMHATGAWQPVPTLLTGCQPAGPVEAGFFGECVDKIC